jgi:hypothetical protein
MKEERIKFYKPRAIALIGLSPNRTPPPPILELSESCESWMLGIQSIEGNMQEKIEAILGHSKDDEELHPFVIKNVDSCEEVELIVRYKSKDEHSTENR